MALSKASFLPRKFSADEQAAQDEQDYTVRWSVECVLADGNPVKVLVLKLTN